LHHLHRSIHSIQQLRNQILSMTLQRQRQHQLLLLQ
jgi:hypothetical protein